MNAQLIIDNRKLVVPHTACPHRFIVNVAVFTEKGIKRCITETIGTRIIFLAAIIGVSRLLEDFSRYPHATS